MAVIWTIALSPQPLTLMNRHKVHKGGNQEVGLNSTRSREVGEKKGYFGTVIIEEETRGLVLC